MPDGKAWSAIEDCLVGRWVELHADDADRVAECIADLPAVVLRLAQVEAAPELQSACAAAEYSITQMNAPMAAVGKLLTACIPALAHADAGVASAAERVVLAASRRAEEDDQGVIETAIACAAQQYAIHGRSGVMHAAVAVSSRDNTRGPVAQWLKSAGPERSAFAAALRGGRDESVGVLRAWEFLSKPWATSACEDRLMRATDAGRAAILPAWWLAMHPARAARLKQPKLGAALWPGTSWADAEHRRASMSISKFVKPDGKTMFAACELALADPDPAVRLAALEVAPFSLLRDFCFDEDECVARAAAIRASSVGEIDRDKSELWAKLERSPHASVREIAASELSAGRADVWSALARDRAAVEAQVSMEWDESEAEERAGLIVRVRRAGLEPVLAERLIDTVRTGEPNDPSVSAAASALAAVPGPAAAEALAEGLQRDDARLRSNAVEALVRRERVLGERAMWLPISLLELKDDPHHRVRATSLRAIYMRAAAGSEGDIARGLAASGAVSLSKGSSSERLASLWLADRLLGLSPIEASWRGKLIEIARESEDETGRLGDRARGLLERFDAESNDEEPGAMLALVD